MTRTHERELDLGPEAFTLPPIKEEPERIPVAFEPDEVWEKAVLKEAR